jgi:predicted O-methyltransferase YrrM
MIAVDNMVLRGKIACPCQRASDERVDRVMLPVADGMTLARRRI